MALPLLNRLDMSSRGQLLLDHLENLDDGLAIDDPDHPVLTPTLIRRVSLLDHLDDGMDVDDDDQAFVEGPAFVPTEETVPLSEEDVVTFPGEAPPIAFLVLMVLVGATAAALTFRHQVAQFF